MLEPVPKLKNTEGVWKPKLFLVSPPPKHKFLTNKKPKKECFENARNYLFEYCQESSVHGVKYIGQRGRTYVEMFTWTIIVVSLCTACIIHIRQAYVKWEGAPVTVSFSDKEVPISEIPFPAVTVCPEVKFDPAKFNYTRTFQKKRYGGRLTAQEEEYLQIAFLLCEVCVECKELFGDLEWNATITTNVTRKLREILPPFDPLNVTVIIWLGKLLRPSSKAFSYSLTSEGICYTFNKLPYEEIVRDGYQFNHSLDFRHKSYKWTLEEGYPPGENLDAFPRRTFMSGTDGGFTINYIATNDSHLDYLCGESLQGFKIALHHPSEFPNMDRHFRLPLNQAVFVGIRPSLITVSLELLSYPPKARKCYFEQEKYLASYKYYTQQNCLDECLVNYTMAHCGCIPFYFSLIRKNTKVCGAALTACVKESKLQYLKNEIHPNSYGRKCNCLPSCTSLSYDVETSQTDWPWQKALKTINIEYFSHLNPNNLHVSKLSVFYKDLQFLSYRREEVYGSLNFFSNIGGLLGLFIGFSVTSAVEIVYFLTLRIFCNIRKYGRRAWFGQSKFGRFMK